MELEDLLQNVLDIQQANVGAIMDLAHFRQNQGLRSADQHKNGEVEGLLFVRPRLSPGGRYDGESD